MCGSALFSLAFLLGLCQAGWAQDVVSASSGVLHYFEGRVLVDDKPVEHKVAVFPNLKNGSTLHTEKGRAELLLTPGVYLRIDEDSSLRMASNSLADTRVEITGGSAILDTLNASSSGQLTLVYRESAIHFPKPGIYRIDCELSDLEVFTGEAIVSHQKASTKVSPSEIYYFELELSIGKIGDGAMDEFYDWARNRSDSIAEQNQIASAQQGDADDPDPSAGAGLLRSLPAIPPVPYASPGSSALGYPTYGNSLGYSSIVNSPYLNSTYPFLGFYGSPNLVLLAPFRHRPNGAKWPVSAGLGYHPRPPVISRWPAPRQSGYSSYLSGTTRLGGSLPGSSLPATGLRFPVGPAYHAPGISPVRPPAFSAPRAPAAGISRGAAPHVGAVGHR